MDKSVKESGDWRWMSNFNRDMLSRARQTSFHTDVVFKVGKEAKEFSAHKLLLAIYSPVFEAMFYGDLAEGKEPISIIDIEPEAFGMLIKYIYDDPIAFDSILCAAKTYVAADKYQMVGLMVLVHQELGTMEIKDSDFWEMAEQGKFYLSIHVFKEIFLNYFKNHAHYLLRHECFLDLSPTIVKMLLNTDFVKVSEYELLCAICRWGKGHFSPENELRKELFDIIRLIRFSAISLIDFVRFDDCFPGIITKDDTMAIVKYLVDRNTYNLPNWCSTETRMRCHSDITFNFNDYNMMRRFTIDYKRNLHE